MFPLPYASPFDAILYVLLAADVLLLLGGVLLPPVKPAREGAISRPVAITLSSLLVVAAFIQWRLAGRLTGYAGWVLLGMALGLLGDLIMARLIPVPDRLIFGMLAFGAGHVVYIVALVTLSTSLGLWHPVLQGSLWVLLALVGAVLWYTLVRKPGGNPMLNGAALGYSLLMVSMNSLAIALALQSAHFIPLALGALAFLASDLILGHGNIRGKSFHRIGDVIWLTYNPAQLLIVFSVAAAILANL